jgi:1,2-diacylglycerol 3-alpha-glucosyltransferase
MRIAISSFNSPWALTGGVEVHAWEISKALAALGNEVHYFFSGTDDQITQSERDNITLHTVKTPFWNILSPNKRRLGLQHFNKKVQNEVQKWKCDIFHSQNFDGMTLVPCRIPTYVTVHTTPYVRYLRSLESFPKGFCNSLVTYHEYCVCKKASKYAEFISISEGVRSELMKYHSVNSTVIPNGVNIPKIIPKEQARSYLGIGGWQKVVLFFSRVTKQKGAHKLLEVLKHQPDMGLLIAGDGPYLPEIKRKVLADRLENRVKMFGFVPPEDLQYIFSASDCFALPSDQVEGQPITILEAMSYNLPCYVTDIEWVPNYLRQHAVSGDLMSGIEKVLRMGGNEIQVLTWVDVASKFCEIYENTVVSKSVG